MALCVPVGLCVCILKIEQLELSTLNLVHIYSMAGSRHALTPRSQGQGYRFIKCAAAVGMHVVMTA